MRPTARLRRGALALLGTAVLCPSPVHGQASDAYQALETASEVYAAVEATCADFHQRLSVPLLQEEREGHGRLCQARPNLFSMRFQEPDGDAVVVDGEYAWMYTPSQTPEQVLRTAASNIGDGLDFHREFLESPREKYEAELEGVEEVDGRSCRRILLEPREPAGYETAVVWIDTVDHLLRRVEVREENGSVRRVTLTNVEVNLTVPPEVFTFTPPPGTRVITR